MTTAAWILRGAMNSGLQRWTGVLQVPSHHRFRFINCKIPSNESFLESRSSLKHSCGRPHSTVRSQSTPIDTSFLYFVFESVALNLNLKAHFSLYHSYSFRLFLKLTWDPIDVRVESFGCGWVLYSQPNANSILSRTQTQDKSKVRTHAKIDLLKQNHQLSIGILVGERKR